MGPMIAPFWDDLICLAPCQVWGATTGRAPNRIFTVEYRNIRTLLGSSQLTFEVQLVETSNDIWVVYQKMPPPDGSGNSATLGIQNGTIAFPYSFNEPIIQSDLAIRYFVAQPPTPTPTNTATPTNTPTATATPTPCPRRLLLHRSRRWRAGSATQW